MGLKQNQVDAFATRPFEGNPAAVCPLESWPDGSLLQAIAHENNLSETAFLVACDTGFDLRWFTPVREVDLCGHATLATAHVLFEDLGHAGTELVFTTRSRALSVVRDGGELSMDFPATRPAACAPPQELIDGLGVQPTEILAADDYIAVFDDEAAVRAVDPDPA